MGVRFVYKSSFRNSHPSPFCVWDSTSSSFDLWDVHRRLVLLSKDRGSSRTPSPLKLFTHHGREWYPEVSGSTSSGVLEIPVNLTVPIDESLYRSWLRTHFGSPKQYPYRRHVVLVPTGRGFLVEPGRSCRPRIGTPRCLVSTPGSSSECPNLVRRFLPTQLETGGL